MPEGRLILVLHAHLPRVVEDGFPDTLELHWLHSAIAECYLPCLEVMQRWEQDGIPWKICLSVSPTLLEMLEIPEVQRLTTRYLENRIRLMDAARGFRHLSADLYSPLDEVRREYVARSNQWQDIGGDLLRAWRGLAATGRLEFMAGPATHPILPFLCPFPGLLRRQLSEGREIVKSKLGVRPGGWWLPECAYTRPLDPYLLHEGCRWIVGSFEGFQRAVPRPADATFAPVRTPGGLVLFPRDPRTAKTIWSRSDGYPGDPRYREFHRDLGWDAGEAEIRSHLPCREGRAPTGVKLHRITGATGAKEPYDSAEARKAVREHVNHVVNVCREHCRAARSAGLGRIPVLTMPFDAELFGHWWHEGPAFLDQWVRSAAENNLEWCHPGEILDEPLEIVEIADSSWGERGHWNHWMDPTNADMQLRLMECERVWSGAAKCGLARSPVLEEATRHLMLAQASDWTFLARSGTGGTFPRSRFDFHIRECKAGLARLGLGSGSPLILGSNLCKSA